LALQYDPTNQRRVNEKHPRGKRPVFKRDDVNSLLGVPRFRIVTIHKMWITKSFI